MRNGKIIDEHGDTFYYKDDELHRIDGPAVEWWDGRKHWWINGFNYSEAEYIVEIRKIKIEILKEL